jgi:hypothetical protein
MKTVQSQFNQGDLVLRKVVLSNMIKKIIETFLRTELMKILLKFKLKIQDEIALYLKRGFILMLIAIIKVKMTQMMI